MPTTTTPRMQQIAAELQEEGRYTQANSVDAITSERDAMLAALNYAEHNTTLPSYVLKVVRAAIALAEMHK